MLFTQGIRHTGKAVEIAGVLSHGYVGINQNDFTHIFLIGIT